jgi:hypothetical protein
MQLISGGISRRARLRAGWLQTAIEKVFWYNRERIGVALLER